MQTYIQQQILAVYKFVYFYRYDDVLTSVRKVLLYKQLVLSSV